MPTFPISLSSLLTICRPIAPSPARRDWDMGRIGMSKQWKEPLGDIFTRGMERVWYCRLYEHSTSHRLVSHIRFRNSFIHRIDTYDSALQSARTYTYGHSSVTHPSSHHSESHEPTSLSLLSRKQCRSHKRKKTQNQHGRAARKHMVHGQKEDY